MQYPSYTQPMTRPISAFGNPQGGATPFSAPFTPQYVTAGQLPAFQPPPPVSPLDAWQDEPDLETKFPGYPEKEAAAKPSALDKLGNVGVGNFLTIVGASILVLVALTPVWDSTRLLYSATFVYFLGRSLCFWIIVFCCAVVLFFIVAMLLMEKLGRREVKTDQKFMYLFTSMITTLGLGLLLFSVPLRTESIAAYNELMVTCSTGPRTEPLHAYYNGLLDMRLKPDCINMVSIEQCPGFQAHYPYTGFLKHMELTYECSGFCYTPGSKTLPSTALPPLTAVLAQGGATHSNATQGLNKSLSKSVPMWEQLPQGPGDTVNNMIATGWMSEYPPNLFTDAYYKASCEGAAARELRFSAQASATLMYLEGAALLLTSILLGFLKLCAMCNKRSTAEQNLAAATPDGEGQYQTFSKKIVL